MDPSSQFEPGMFESEGPIAEDFPAIEIVDGSMEEYLPSSRELFREYGSWGDAVPCFTSLDAELQRLPGEYAPPEGRLLLARSGSASAGMVSLRPLSESRCEMKRLWVRPEFRGQGVGMLLVKTLLQEAREIGYSEMVLDTLPVMKSAQRIYREFGFGECESYYDAPPTSIFMRLAL